MVTTSPAQARTMSGSGTPSSLPAQSQIPAPRRQCSCGLVDREVLQLRLLVDDDEVDVRARAQAVVGDRQQRVGVRRQVDPGHRTACVSTVWIRPGPWWLKPLWSLRHAVEVSSMLRLGTLARQGRCSASSSHLACWTVWEALTIAKASYVANMPCRPVKRVALEPAVAVVLGEHLHHPARCVTARRRPAGPPPSRRGRTASKTAPSRLLLVSSGQNSRNVSGLSR